jgi:hypothetical protein
MPSLKCVCYNSPKTTFSVFMKRGRLWIGYKRLTGLLVVERVQRV